MNRLSYVSDHHIKNKNDITGLNIYTLFPCSGVHHYKGLINITEILSVGV